MGGVPLGTVENFHNDWVTRVCVSCPESEKEAIESGMVYIKRIVAAFLQGDSFTSVFQDQPVCLSSQIQPSRWGWFASPSR